jgi:hypothetical protein
MVNRKKMIKTKNTIIQIGKITPKVAVILDVVPVDSPILLSESTINHIQNRHPKDYARYGKYIAKIINTPDYVGLRPTDGTVVYVKEFTFENENVKLAVRATKKGVLFVRSLYVITESRLDNYLKKGTVKVLT